MRKENILLLKLDELLFTFFLFLVPFATKLEALINDFFAYQQFCCIARAKDVS